MQAKGTTQSRTYSLAADYLSKINRNPQAKIVQPIQLYRCAGTWEHIGRASIQPTTASKLNFIEAVLCQMELIFWDSLINLADLLRRHRLIQRALLPFKSDGWSQVVWPFLYWSVVGLIIGLALGYIRGFLP